MLQFNIPRILRARGIDKPFAYLKKNGFPDALASNLKNNKVGRMNLSTVERLCLVLRCTPNDLMEWVPDGDHKADTTHPLTKIKRSEKIIDIAETLKSVPLDQLESIEQLIKDSIRKNE